MATKRMFSKDIVESDAFLDMSTSAQALYFHLSLNADDYGVVSSPKSVLRMVGCNDDDLRLLITKRFVLPHESGVIVIKHWRINNNIRTDRLRDTPYEDVLKGLHIKENKAYTDDLSQGEPVLCLTDDGQMTDKCLTDDGQMTDKCPHSLVKSSLVKNSIGESSIDHHRSVKGSSRPVETVDNSGRPVDNSDEPVGKPDSIVSRLSDDDFARLDDEFNDIVHLLDEVDRRLARRGKKTRISEPYCYIKSAAESMNWPRK